MEVVDGLPCNMLLGMNLLGSREIISISPADKTLYLRHEKLKLFTEERCGAWRECSDVLLVSGEVIPDSVYNIEEEKPRIEGTCESTRKLQADLERTLSTLKAIRLFEVSDVNERTRIKRE